MALRNYVQRRNHKERSQPEHRKHLGLLEKHKDYVERARAHHIKRDKLQRLRQKAADRNQDEFYLGMIGKKTEKGVHIESRGNKALDNDVVSLLKTQDAGYLRKQLNSERKKYQALIEELAPRVPGMRLAYLEKKPDLVTALRKANLLGDVQTSSASAQQQGRVQGFGKKTKWVDDVEELKQVAKENRRKSKKKETLEEEQDERLVQAEKIGERQLSIKIRELATRQRRIDALTEASQKLDVVRSLMRTRGSHAVPKKQVQELKDAVGKRGAKVTSRGR
ncbi:u3 small nucleolar rna-associated protein 11 [Malassezia pachydermatis]|uniref:U3 small nucleolar RNA-associated protein 11 n=1 Tax=Malassezia pachydermatis TaxID=77020 RepID=A0A0M9VNN4_9BASI|nr:u3 small nucleolar rna-associated protein 11 [Malassezia pachydermatis]KOS13533.1 u3 small nucleolar rna-associated protein 11 [Malassezia pachydermatis]